MEVPGDGEQDWDRQLADLWQRQRPWIVARVERLEALVAADDPTVEQVEEGRVEAHKLRGLLGTIGLPQGSVEAGEIEDLLAAGDLAIAAPLERLAALIREHDAGR